MNLDPVKVKVTVLQYMARLHVHNEIVRSIWLLCFIRYIFESPSSITVNLFTLFSGTR